MHGMTPFEFADGYHQLDVQDSRLGLNVTLNISTYKSDWAADVVAEATAVLDRVAIRILKLRGAGAVPAVFKIPDSPNADPDEEFCCAGIRRAFCSRGSPRDIEDALRIAALVGRPGPLSPKAYAEKWFGQDCYAFAGNWLGLSPMVAIGSSATGTGLGTTAGEQDSRQFLPLPPRSDASHDLWGISEGDPLPTFGELDKRGSPWRHIAIVHSLAGSLDAAALCIAEWGEAGSKPQHYPGPYSVELIPNLLDWKPAKGW
jgi:hypothetical protein